MRPRRDRRHAAGTACAIALCFLLVVGCDGETREQPTADPGLAADRSRPAEPLPGALYHTELTFVGSGAPPSLLHLRFDNRTDSTSLRLRYRGWFAGEEWRAIVEHRDSLPVPRAAWRVLPMGDLRVIAGEGGEMASLVLDLDDGSLRLDSRGAIASWNSSTGQRESLRLAELLGGPGGEAGFLLTRQRARRDDEPVSAAVAQYFLVADTAGNGVLLMRDSTVPDAPVTVRTWFDEVEAEWSDALILTLAAPEGSPGRWSFEVPQAGLNGELRGVSPRWNELGPGDPGFDIFRIEGALALDGEPWTVSGVGVQERGP